MSVVSDYEWQVAQLIAEVRQLRTERDTLHHALSKCVVALETCMLYTDNGRRVKIFDESLVLKAVTSARPLLKALHKG